MYVIKEILLKVVYLNFSVLLVTINSSSGINNTTRFQRQVNENSTSGKSCILPEYPNHGKWSVVGKSSNYLPKMSIDNGALLEINCDVGYKLDGSKWIFCNDETWNLNIGQCLRTCPPIYSTPSMKVTCQYKNQVTENCTDAIDGTLVKFECAPYYEDPGLRNMPVHLCRDGSWDQRTPECVPVCGRKSVSATPLIIGGTPVKHGDYPWQVAVYNVENKILLCGGSLISQRVVLTAAHCITDFKGNIRSKDLYMVAVGKYYRSYDDSRDVNKAEFSSLQEIFIPRQYKGPDQNYVGDIAILVTTKTFTISQRVQPVCVDWGSNSVNELSNLSSSSYGYVTGWGFTSENANPSEELKELRVPLITYDQCSQNLPEDYEIYLTYDKFCAGYLDKGVGICKGDTGSGLVLKHKDRYYITGIVSLSPGTPTGGCDSQQYGLYTSVDKYKEEFILDKVSRFKPEGTGMDRQNYCVLPEYPDHGKWSVVGKSADYLPGVPIDTGTVLQIYCNRGYKLVDEEFLKCENGKWSSKIGKCLKTCPTIYSNSIMKVTCMHNNKKTENCTDAIDGTLAKFECAPYYEDLALRNMPVHLCRDGSWDQRTPECVPVCGRKSVSATPLIIGGTPVKHGDYPWQVAVYNVENKILICGGSLISQRVVLTAAHCITDFKGKIRPKNLYMVAVGKYYRSYNDSRDVNKAEFSSLQEIFIPRQYKGPNQNYFADIAILVTTKTFTISQRVQPVCVDWGLNYASELSNLSSSSYGHVTGWGFTSEDANPSEELRELRLPLVTREQCSLNLPEDYEIYFTYDKFCAGYLNKSVGICKGDAGSGLMLKHNDRYYITGIVSIGVRSSTGGCDSQQYGLYTSVYKYLEEFILDKISRFKPDNTKIDQLNENCILPKHPENGQWSVINSTLLQEPGESVTSGTAINLTCDESYTLDGPTFIQCKTGKWDDTIGICLTMCPTLISTSFITFTCINNNNNNCINPTHGTIATLKCAPFYENLDLDRNPFITCQNGRWSSQIPTCVPVCGIKPQSLNLEKKPYYPWNVAIYEREGETKNFKCAGTLINERIILTSAQCVCNTYGEKFPAINFKVAAGKSLENFEDSRDSEAQYSDLEDIFVPREYKGYTRRYRADIAILITKTPFTITEKVQLACLDWNNKYFNEFNYLEVKGYIAGPLASELSLREVIQIDVPFVNETQCYHQLSTKTDPNFDTSYYTYDKLCSGYINSDKAPLCKINRGTGLVTKNRYDNRYYLIGIISIFPATSSENCDNQRWILFTEVSKYTSNFIVEKYKLYTPVNTPYYQSSCGVKSVQATTLIVHGNNVTRSDYPWQVAIYRTNATKKELICGGTLINQRIILTAAHCVTDDEGNKLSKELFIVAAGKYYRDFDHPADKGAQFSTLIDVSVAFQYQGYLQNYLGDIAVLITENSFILSKTVEPICIDWNDKYETQFFKPETSGFVSGWGFTQENRDPSQILKELEVPYIRNEQCKENIPFDYHIYLTYDKMCLGYLNKSKAVCRGDSGGGLVFRNGIDGRYYITGIVSLSPQAPKGGCDSQRYTLYTKVSVYVKNFIQNYVQLYWR